MSLEMPSPAPFVYIILLNWNGWEDTLACLSTLEKLEYPYYSIIVVDNASEDSSAERIRKAKPNIGLIESEENLGFSGGCNLGIRFAQKHEADYVWLLNNDTCAMPNSLTAMVKVAEADESIGAVGSVIYYMNDERKIQAWGGGWVNFMTGRSGHHLSPVPTDKLDYLTGASMLIRGKAINNVGMLDEKTYFMYWEDTDYCFRLKKAGWSMAVACESVIYHKEGASIGKGTPMLDFYSTQSAVCFFKRYAFISIWPIGVGVMGRMIKRLTRAEFKRALSVVVGVMKGLRK